MMQAMSYGNLQHTSLHYEWFHVGIIMPYSDTLPDECAYYTWFG
jgi:hypothetical protein